MSADVPQPERLENRTGTNAPPGWQPLPEEPLPLPTFWPAGLGLGTTFVFWGLISSWVVLAVGIALFAVSLGGWIRHLRYERKQHHSH